MKCCGACHRLFDDTSGFCPADGTKLEVADPSRPPTDPTEPRVGQTLCGRYVIFRTVADGGMGRVFQAFDLELARGVALKVLHPEFSSDDVAVARFRREFEVSKMLRHPNIVEVLGLERAEDGSYVLAMEYLEGEELRTLLRREGSMPLARIVRMVSQVALGLTGAHAARQVHRDLKPDNIFLCHTPKGSECKILDFGSVRDNNHSAKKLTVMGTTIGSPFYMSPEQAQGLESLDHRADVWSLAAITYECLAGRVPFQGSTGPAILLAILSKDPPLISEAGKAQNAPESLDPVIERALAKQPAIRHPTIGSFADSFGEALGLSGGHESWAAIDEDTLTAQIEQSLPEALAKFRQQHGAAVPAELRTMDAVFEAQAAQGSGLPDDLIIMGLPSKSRVPTFALIGVALAAALGVAVWLSLR